MEMENTTAPEEMPEIAPPDEISPPPAEETASGAEAPAPGTETEVPNTESSDPSAPEGPPETPAVKKKRRKTPWIIAAAALLFLAMLAVVLTPILIRQGKIRRYNRGADLLEQGDYSGAYEVFSALGDYEDAPLITVYAQRGIGYTEAKSLIEQEEYDQAAEILEGLFGFKDSAELAARCRQEAAYRQGLDLFAAEDYPGAIRILQSLPGYKEADHYVNFAHQEIDYRRALELFEAEDYSGAVEILENLSGFKDAEDYVNISKERMARTAYDEAIAAGDFKTALTLLEAGEGHWENADELREACENHLLYMEADKELSKGNNYTAWKKFKSLGSFMDAKEKAKSCKVKKPSTGETYRNSKYKGTAVYLTIVPPEDDNCNYLKIYAINSNGKEVLASCVFIRAGKKATVKLPAGKYTVKAAYGSGDWFGDKEMFGEDAVYQKLLFNGSKSQITLQRNHKYTLTLRTATDGNVGTAPESMGTF